MKALLKKAPYYAFFSIIFLSEGLYTAKEALVDTGQMNRWAEHFSDDERDSRFIKDALTIFNEDHNSQIMTFDEMMPGWLDHAQKLPDCRVSQAKKFFGDRLNYDDVQIHQAVLHLPYPVVGTTIGHDIYFSKEDYKKYFVCTDHDDTNLEHELTHVRQYELYGARALNEKEKTALRQVNYKRNALYTDDYKKTFEELNPEQQAVRVANASASLKKIETKKAAHIPLSDDPQDSALREFRLAYNTVCPIKVGLKIQPDCRAEGEALAEAIEHLPPSRPGMTFFEITSDNLWHERRACHIRRDVGLVPNCDDVEEEFLDYINHNSRDGIYSAVGNRPRTELKIPHLR
jgi:hypothetical protein